MNYRFVIDAYAWIEYFRASEAGRLTQRYIEEEEAATPTIVVAEVSRKLLKEVRAGRESPDGRQGRLEFIRASTQILELDFDLAQRAGELDVERKQVVERWGIADSIVLASARAAEAKVVTGDEHFKDLKDEVILIR